MSKHYDFPIDEMVAAANGKIGAAAVFAALLVLQDNRGAVHFPMPGGAWAPDVYALERRWKNRERYARKRVVTNNVQRLRVP